MRASRTARLAATFINARLAFERDALVPGFGTSFRNGAFLRAGERCSNVNIRRDPKSGMPSMLEAPIFLIAKPALERQTDAGGAQCGPCAHCAHGLCDAVQ
jgi:hypothetical protein